MQRRIRALEPLLALPAWWRYPSSPARVAGGPGNALCRQPVPAPARRLQHEETCFYYCSKTQFLYLLTYKPVV